jgi:hypothetical protein
MKRTLLIEIEAGDKKCNDCPNCNNVGISGCRQWPTAEDIGWNKRVYRLPACLEAEKRAKGEKR